MVLNNMVRPFNAITKRTIWVSFAKRKHETLRHACVCSTGEAELTERSFDTYKKIPLTGHRPNIGAVLPLAEAAEAQEMNRTGRVKGKIVLTVV